MAEKTKQVRRESLRSGPGVHARPFVLRPHVSGAGRVGGVFRGLVLVLGLWAAGPAAAEADVYRMLTSNHEAAQCRVDLIEQAQQEINAAYYIVGEDRFTGMYLGLLRDAALRGVRVRLLVDGFHNHIPPQAQAALIRDGVEIKEYHPLGGMDPRWYNERLHDKLLLIDADQMIVGSRNLEGIYFGQQPVRVDRDAYVRGAACLDAWKYFDCLWHCSEVASIELADVEKRDSPGCCCPVCADKWLSWGIIEVGCMPVMRGLCSDWSACQPDLGCVQFVCDPLGRKDCGESCGPQMLKLIDRAQCSLTLEAPYFILSKSLHAALHRARQRGVHVRVITNSLASTNSSLVYAEFENQKPKLLAMGIELWEYAGPEHFHCKSALVDDCIVAIGSYNFDPRSEFLNTELAVVVADPCLAQQVADSIACQLQRAYRLGPDGKPIGASERYPAASVCEQVKMMPLRLFTPLIRKSL